MKIQIEFNPINHSYIIDGKTNTISVTQLVKQVYPFDEQRIAYAYARKHGLSVEEVLASWKQVAERGSRVHEVAEAYILGKPEPEGRPEEKPYYDQIKKAIDRLRKTVEDEGLTFKASPEMMVGTTFSLVAGTIDLLVDLGNKCYMLIDYKSCKKMPQSKLNKYSLQLALYKVILLKHYLPEGSRVECFVCWVTPDNATWFSDEPKPNDPRHLMDQTIAAKELLNQRYLRLKKMAA